MRFVEFAIAFGPEDGRYQYPAVYNARSIEAEKSGPLIYNDNSRRKRSGSAVLVRFEDDALVARKYQGETGVRVLRDEAAADAWILANTQDEPLDTIDDTDRFLLILAKQAVGATMTQDDIDSTDPTSPVPGVRRKRKTAAGFFDRP